MSLQYWESMPIPVFGKFTEIMVGHYPNGENIGTIQLQEDDGKWSLISGYDRRPDGKLYGRRRGFKSKEAVIEYAMGCYVISMEAALQEARRAILEFQNNPGDMSSYPTKL